MEFLQARRPVLELLVCVYGYLLVSSLVTLVHPRLRRPEAQKIRQAVTSWWWPSLYGGVLVVLGGPLAVVLTGLLSLFALREYLRLLPPSDRNPGMDILAYLSVPLHYGSMLLLPLWAQHTVLLLWAVAVTPLLRAWILGSSGFLAATGRIAFGILLTTFALGHVAQILLLSTPGSTSRYPTSAGYAALLLLCVMFADASQFLFGKLFGKTKLAPRLSPGKTKEGLFGGVLFTAMLAAFAAPHLTPLSCWAGVLVGAGLCILGLFGDLLVSAIKRDTGVKDSGTLLPGQGGLLDRCDSLLLSAPLYFVVLVGVGLVVFNR